jgi:hypothetical protein
VRFGALDSAPVRLGGTVAEALAAALTRARDLDALGCHRLWFTKHHIAHLAELTAGVPVP